ncbi:MAG: crossover junction endodeoxyribonuclease RuvC [Fimbriimonas sp.]
MRILGIDPGLERIGFGLLNRQGSQLSAIELGLLVTPRIELPLRLADLHHQVVELLDRTQPDSVATERLLFTVNKTTAMDVAKALGVVLLEVGRRGIPWCEYSPPEVKLSVVGNGAAEKKQVQFMVTKILGLRETPKPDDVADALAIAICHAFRAPRVGNG